MTEADREAVHKHFRKIRVTVFIVTPIVLIASLILFQDPDRLSPIGYWAAGLVLFIAAAVLFRSGRRLERVLASGEKTIIQGVVTNKEKDETEDTIDFFIEIGHQEKVMIRPSDYAKLEKGDLVNVELIGSSLKPVSCKIEKRRSAKK